MQKLFFFNTDEIPQHVVTSTARRGLDWDDKVKLGDVVAVYTVGHPDKPVGHSVVVAKQKLELQDVLDSSDSSTVGYGTGRKQRPALYDTLVRAYGEVADFDIFTVLHLLPLNNVEDAANEQLKLLAQSVTDDVISDAHDQVQTAGRIAFDAQQRAEVIYDTAMATVLKFSEALADENKRAEGFKAQLEVTEDALESALEPNEVDSRYVVDAGVNAAAAHLAAFGEGAFIRAIEQVTDVGDVSRVIRVEF